MNIDYSTDPISAAKWHSVLKDAEHVTFFQTHEWMQILKHSFGYRDASRICSIDGIEALIPMVKKRRHIFTVMDSLPIGYGGPISPQEISPEVISALAQSIIGGRNILLSLTLPPTSPQHLNVKGNVQPVETEWDFTHLLHLEKGFDHLWKKVFRHGVKESIRKAEKQGVETYLTDREEDYRRLYEIYAAGTREWGYREPPLPLQLFLCLHRYGGPYVKLRFAEREGEVIAGLITLEYGGYTFAYVEGTIREYNKYRPLHRMVGDAILHACESGHQIFDLGASGNVAGARQFKELFGAEKVDIRRYWVLSHLGKYLIKLKGTNGAL